MDEAQRENAKRRRQAARKRMGAENAPNAVVYKAFRTYVPEGLALLRDGERTACDPTHIEEILRDEWRKIFQHGRETLSQQAEQLIAERGH
eukprot:4715035-Alexandrium_andersonii.AAC.1